MALTLLEAGADVCILSQSAWIVLLDNFGIAVIARLLMETGTTDLRYRMPLATLQMLLCAEAGLWAGDQALAFSDGEGVDVYPKLLAAYFRTPLPFHELIEGEQLCSTWKHLLAASKSRWERLSRHLASCVLSYLVEPRGCSKPAHGNQFIDCAALVSRAWHESCLEFERWVFCQPQNGLNHDLKVHDAPHEYALRRYSYQDLRYQLDYRYNVKAGGPRRSAYEVHTNRIQSVLTIP